MIPLTHPPRPLPWKAVVALLALLVFFIANTYHVMAVNHNLVMAREELDYLHREVLLLKGKPEKQCTTDEAVKWWTDTNKVSDARKKLCGK